MEQEILAHKDVFYLIFFRNTKKSKISGALKILNFYEKKQKILTPPCPSDI